jgi:hypothetical protein
MATRSEIRFATREEGVSFNEIPETIHAKFYAHWDGYPSHRGVEIAESILHGNKVNGWEIESLTANHTDLEYIYYVWQSPGKTTWISIFERVNWSESNPFECIFVGEPEKLIDKYKPNTNEEG